jgi:hypothetical protein
MSESRKRRFLTPTLTGGKLHIIRTVCEQMYGCCLPFMWVQVWLELDFLCCDRRGFPFCHMLREFIPFHTFVTKNHFKRLGTLWRFTPWMCLFGYSWVHNAHLRQGHSGGWGGNDLRLRNFNGQQQSHDRSVCLQFPPQRRISTLQLGTASLYFLNRHRSTHSFLSRS